jgi:hypothetical protein
MRRRLLLSLMTVAMVLAAFTYAAFAYFQTTTSGTVSVSSGTPSLKVEYKARCSGSYGEVSDLNTTWGSIVPGDEIEDCIRITNNGDGALDVYVHNSNFGGNVALRAALNFRVRKADDTVLCSWQVPDGSHYTTDNAGKGCLLADELAPDSSFVVKVGSRFYDDGSDQSSLEGKTATWKTSLDGFTD